MKMKSLVLEDGNKLFYRVKGEGKTILCIHGFGADHGVFRFLERYLSNSFRIISMDLRGHGKSSCKSNNILVSDLSRDINELIKYLQIESFSLMGYSMGGTVALEYIRTFSDVKVEALILIESSLKMINDNSWNSGLFLGEYDHETHEETLKEIEFNWEEFCREFVLKLSKKLNGKNYELAVKNLMNNNNKALLSLWNDMGKVDNRNIALMVDKRVLYISGNDSQFYREEAGKMISSMFKNGEFASVQGGHLLLLENPVEVNRVIEKFLIQIYTP